MRSTSEDRRSGQTRQFFVVATCAVCSLTLFVVSRLVEPVNAEWRFAFTFAAAILIAPALQVISAVFDSRIGRVRSCCYLSPKRLAKAAKSRYCGETGRSVLESDDARELVATLVRGIATTGLKVANASNKQVRSPTALIAYRNAFRLVQIDRPIRDLAGCLNDSGQFVYRNKTVRATVDDQRLALWLLGRCRAVEATALIQSFTHHTNFRARREAARALRRIGAWSELRELQSRESNHRVSCFCRPRSQRPLAERLARLAGDSAPQTPLRESPQPLFVARPFERRTLGRPVELLRRLLWRVHDLVHGPR